VTRLPSPKAGGYAGLAALGLLGALALELPELAALAAPFAVLAGFALAVARPPELTVEAALERERVFEGDEVEVTVTAESRTGIPILEVLVALPAGVELVDGDDPLVARLRAGRPEVRTFRVRAARWGAYDLGRVYVRSRDLLDFFRWETQFALERPLRVYPRPEHAEALLAPAETQVFAGHHVSRGRGDGIEFADLRPFVPGDRVRRVNWRASARRSELWVNEYHPERSADVVVFLDTFAEVGEAGRSTLDRAVRAASSLVAGYLRQKDRVGFVSFGGRVNWLVPRTGVAQLYRIVDSLLESQIVLTYAWRNVDVLPRHTLPPQALVVALTPLLDDRAAAALVDLRARGFDVAVVEISPLEAVEPRAGAGELAYRLWALRREARRARMEGMGIAVTSWREDASFTAALEEVRTYRRYAARAHA
jgi:uncharacterized protein (DUF58 family)